MRNELRDRTGRLVRLESEPATEADASEAIAAGLVLTRRIEQLRISLPLPASETPLLTRAFLPGQDDEAFLRVNNRAFAWHPDQSGLTLAQLADRISEPWFDPQGLLLHEINGELAGFCWTKIHPATDSERELGEIYVIAVDPDFHGSGLGRALTLAGLAYLAAQSVTVGMLHVEHDNTAAVSLYRDLGFSHHDAHSWWALPDGDAS